MANSAPDKTYSCNLLLPQKNLTPDLPDHVLKSVKKVGNWVGGTLTLDCDMLSFSMNKLNGLFQENTENYQLDYVDIVSARFGRMMIFAKTVDLETKSGLVRLRCNGKNNSHLLNDIQQRI